MSSLLLLLFVVLPFLGLETLRSRTNEARLRRRGAIEPRDDVYPWMQIVYPGSFVLMALEGWWHGGARRPWMVVGLVIFLLGKMLKRAAMEALGELWSFRVLVVPGVALVKSGPYRWMRHPNYVALVGEFIGAACLLYAPVTGPICTAAFMVLMYKRILVEERALGLRPVLDRGADESR